MTRIVKAVQQTPGRRLALFCLAGLALLAAALWVAPTLTPPAEAAGLGAVAAQADVGQGIPGPGRIEQAGSWPGWSSGSIPPVSSRRPGDMADARLASAAAQGDGPYHGNVKSKIFHRPGCRWYYCKNCTREFSSRDAAIAAGYRPCKVCQP